MSASQQLWAQFGVDTPWSEGASWTLWDALPELIAVVEAAERVEAFDQSGGNDWWAAHAELYRALAALDAKLGGGE
jgi:hypothetical protein